MFSRMHTVHNAARLAMADHRAALPRRARPASRSGAGAALIVVVVALLLAVLFLASQFSAAG